MFLKKFKNLILSFLLILSIIPINAYAYSDYIAVSGKNVGIQINSKGIMVVGLYSVDGISPGKDANINLGDRIIKINDEVVSSTNQMVNKISNSINKDSVKITYIRDNKEFDTTLKLIKGKDNIYKTGLYVKDSINGIGTLTYVDPESKLFGALGHEIVDKNTSLRMEIDSGKIYKSNVTGISKSANGIPGEKNATFYSNVVYGKIFENTTSGVFGEYIDNIDDLKLYKVAKPEEIKLGDAKILTMLEDNKVGEYDIEITKLNDTKSKIKNISFTITDTKLLEKTGGIVQGMSGSPIIQNDKIIGAVTHVVVDNPKQGYGIYITNMLSEMEN